MRVIFVMGPTASGKSRLALDLCLKYGGRIINCDSIQCYEGLDIGSAKPSEQDFKRCPHELYGWASLGSQITVGDYFRKFNEFTKSLKDPTEILWVVGGTGFYFQALEFGLFEVPAANPEIVAELEEAVLMPEGGARLHEELKAKDPESAKRISVNDHYRLVRAVEMMRSQGKTPSEVKNQKTGEPRLQAFKICLMPEKKDLVPLVEARTQWMLDQGLVAETQRILSRVPRTWRPLQSVGYFEVLKFLAGELSQNELPNLINISTLQLIKKQKTWFKRDPQAHFLKNSSVESFDAQCGQALERFLHTDKKSQ